MSETGDQFEKQNKYCQEHRLTKYGSKPPDNVYFCSVSCGTSDSLLIEVKFHPRRGEAASAGHTLGGVFVRFQSEKERSDGCSEYQCG